MASKFQNIDSADTAFMILATTFVFIQTPAMGIAQAGLLRRKNVLSMITQTMVGVCVGSLLFALVGFSLLWGNTLGGVIGEPWAYPMLWNVQLLESTHKVDANGDPLHTIPEVTFAAFQMMFALMTPVIVTGAWAEKFSMWGFFVFVIMWPLFVYYPLAHWVWNPDGWMAQWGIEDFAGGLVIHTSSGISGLVVAAMLHKRRYMEDASKTHHNLPLFATGSFLIWAGWYFFNGGSASRANAQAATAMMNTHLAACTGSFFWMVASYFEDGKFRLGYFTNGAFAGLAGITAGSGFTTPQGATAIGFCAAAASYLASNWVQRSRHFDDVLDCFALQGAPGIVGSTLVGVFSHKDVAGVEGLVYGGDGSLLGKQIVGVVVTSVLSAVMTAAMIVIMRGSFRQLLEIDDLEDAVGLDLCQIGEAGYDGTLFDDQDRMLLADKLCSAIDKGDYSAFLWLKETVYDTMGSMRIGEKNRAGRTAFHAVASSDAGLFWTQDPVVKEQLEAQFKSQNPKSDAAIKWLSENSEAIKVVNILLDSRCNVNEADNFKRTPLQYAMDRQGDCSATDTEKRHMAGLISFLLSKGALTNPDAAGARLNTAAKAGNIDQLRVVLSWPGVVDLSDYDQRTGLHIAVEEWVQAARNEEEIDENRKQAVKFLLYKNANRHLRDRWGNAPIDEVKEARNEADELLAREVNRNDTSFLGMRRREHAQMVADRMQEIEQTLLVDSPEVAFGKLFEDRKSRKPTVQCPNCHYHYGTPHSPAISVRSDMHCDEETPLCIDESRPLLGSDRHSMKSAVSRFTESTGVTTEIAEQAMSYAASVSGREPLQRLGLQSHQYANIRDAHGLSLLHVACLHGNEDIVEWLISPQGCNAVSLLEAEDAHGHTPMFTAITACHSHDNIPRKLRERYRELHNDEDWPVDHKLGYILCLAAKENNTTFLHALVSAGCPIADHDYDGRTALHLAVCEGHANLVEWLLQYDPRHKALMTKDNKGHTPLDDALIYKNFSNREARKSGDCVSRDSYKKSKGIFNHLRAAQLKHQLQSSSWGTKMSSLYESQEGTSPHPPPIAGDHPYRTDTVREAALSCVGSMVDQGPLLSHHEEIELIVQQVVQAELARRHGEAAAATSDGGDAPSPRSKKSVKF